MIDIGYSLNFESVDNFYNYIKSSLPNDLARLSKQILDDNQKNHLNESDPDGIPWPPSFSGEQRKKQGKRGTLYDTGDLFSGSTIRLGDLGFSIINDVEYAYEHQFGIQQVRRQFLGIPDKFIESFIKDVESRL